MWLGTLLSCHTCWNSSPTSRQAENQLVCENQIFFTSWRIRSGYVRLIYLERGGHVIYIFARPVGRYQVNVSPFVSAPHSPVTSKAATNFSESEWLSRVMKYIVLKRTKETEPSDKQLAKFPLSLRFFFTTGQNGTRLNMQKLTRRERQQERPSKTIAHIIWHQSVVLSRSEDKGKTVTY